MSESQIRTINYLVVFRGDKESRDPDHIENSGYFISLSITT